MASPLIAETSVERAGAAAALEAAYQAGSIPTASGRDYPIRPVGLSRERSAALRGLVVREHAVRTIETGCGLGISGLSIIAGVDDHSGGGGASLHTAIDPGQTAPEWMDSAAILLFERAGVMDRFRLIEKPSELALPVLSEAGEMFDFAFIDGSHWFENVLIDLVFLKRLVKPGGLVVIDDLWMPAVQAAVDYAIKNLGLSATNIGDLEPLHLAALRVPEGPDPRAWDMFEPFGAREAKH